MNKTDYEVTADAVASTEMPIDVRAHLVTNLSNAFKSRNPRFKSDRFASLAFNTLTKEN